MLCHCMAISRDVFDGSKDLGAGLCARGLGKLSHELSWLCGSPVCADLGQAASGRQ